MQEVRDTLADLAEQGTTYVGRLVGEQTLLSVQKVRSGSSPVSVERILLSSFELVCTRSGFVTTLALIRNPNNST